MFTARVDEWKQIPKYLEVPAPPVPAPDADQVQIKVIAAGLHALVRLRVTGTHYSAKTLPHVPGTDGVGITTDGRTVYFSSIAVGGSFSDIVNIPKAATFDLGSVDPLQAAAYVNPASSSWLAIKTRTQDLPKDFTVLILGATSASGAIAVQFARELGAGKVIGAARNATALGQLGLDETIVLGSTETDFSKAGDVDLVLDYLYGKPTEQLFATLASKRHTQYVQIGSLAGNDISLPSGVLRSRNITVRGSGPGAWSIPEFISVIPGMLKAMAKLPKYPVTAIPLKDIEKAWTEKYADRLVFTMN